MICKTKIACGLIVFTEIDIIDLKFTYKQNWLKLLIHVLDEKVLHQHFFFNLETEETFIPSHLLQKEYQKFILTCFTYLVLNC